MTPSDARTLTGPCTRRLAGLPPDPAELKLVPEPAPCSALLPPPSPPVQPRRLFEEKEEPAACCTLPSPSSTPAHEPRARELEEVKRMGASMPPAACCLLLAAPSSQELCLEELSASSSGCEGAGG